MKTECVAVEVVNILWCMCGQAHGKGWALCHISVVSRDAAGQTKDLPQVREVVKLKKEVIVVLTTLTFNICTIATINQDYKNKCGPPKEKMFVLVLTLACFEEREMGQDPAC